MTTLEDKCDVASSHVFETGAYQVTNITVRTRHATTPPVELFIVSPVTKGTYPVLLFCHGFEITNTWYTDLLHHIASHGYIIVAHTTYFCILTPKTKFSLKSFYGLIPCSIPEEVKRASRVTEWLSTGLPVVLPETVNPDIEKLALSGHSRGGKTAFALALGRLDQKSHKNRATVSDNNNTAAQPKFKALIGIDPVAGTAPANVPQPKILEYIPRCFDMSIPVAVIGTGYGNQPLGLVPAFAPNGVNHSEFFNESKPPAFYFLAKEYGHCDMLDEWVANLASYVCKSGNGPRDLMRRSVGGIVVAFLESYLGGDEDDLNTIVNNPTVAPITLDPVIYVKE